MIAPSTDASAVTPEQIQQVAKEAKSAIDSWGVKQKDLARAVGYSSTVISEFFSGRYAGNAGQIAIELQRWMDEEEERRRRPQTSQFVWTNVALQIKSVATYCLDFRKIGLVYGPDTAGIGKTTALQAIAQDLGPRRCTLVSIDTTDGSPTGLLRKICDSLHISDNRSTHAMFNRIVQSIMGRSHLLLLDQVHSLRGGRNDLALFTLMDLYNRTNTAQLWCGTADMVAYLERERARTADESLAQIRSRIFPCVDLMEGVGPDGGGAMLADVDLVREMFAKNRLKLTAAAARFLCQLINTPDSGGIRICVQIIEYATMLGERTKATAIDVPLLRQALQRGLTIDHARILLARVDEPERPQAIAKTA